MSAYRLTKQGLLDLSHLDNDNDMYEYCCEYLEATYAYVDVIAYDGTIVRGFTEGRYEYLLSGHVNKYNTATGHDRAFAIERAESISLIGPVLTGSVKSEVLMINRGSARNPKRILYITSEHPKSDYYVIELSEIKNKAGKKYAILTAFPTSAEYITKCLKASRGAATIGKWGK